MAERPKRLKHEDRIKALEDRPNLGATLLSNVYGNLDQVSDQVADLERRCSTLELDVAALVQHASGIEVALVEVTQATGGTVTRIEGGKRFSPKKSRPWYKRIFWI